MYVRTERRKCRVHMMKLHGKSSKRKERGKLCSYQGGIEVGQNEEGIKNKDSFSNFVAIHSILRKSSSEVEE